MCSAIAHIGLTVSDLDRSVVFYRDILGLSFVGEMKMEGPSTEKLFQRPGCRARVAYLQSGRSPLIELICFSGAAVRKQPADLFTTSISEICFETDSIDRDYEKMKRKGVSFLSEPQTFDSTRYGFGKSRAVYFRDPDGNILELIQPIESD